MKRFLSAVVCLALVLTMLPAVALLSAQAAEEATYTYVTQTPASIIPMNNNTKGAWYNNGSTFVTDAGSANYIEIVADGYKDTGALHVYQDNVANNDMSVGMYLGGNPAGTYTVKMYVKGDLGHMGQTCRFYPYGCIDQAPNLHNALGTTDVADWTEVSYQINATSDFYYFIFTFSKYNWKTDFYVDNIQLINSSGVNVLGNGGNFYSMEEVTVNSADTCQLPNEAVLDTDTISNAYGGSLSDAWTPMYPSGNPGDPTWAMWNETHYAQIVANGYADAGSLHLVSTDGDNTGIAINAGMIPGQTYTLGLWAKGTVNTGKVMGMYANGDGVIIGNTASFLPGWNYYSHTFTAGMSQLNLVVANWGSVDIYVDNITLTDANGNDILNGIGNFCQSTNAHEHTVVIDQAVAAGCESTGLTEGSHCETCGEVIVAQTEIPALGHSYESVVTAPTAIKDGYTTHTCVNCGDSYTDSTVPAIGIGDLAISGASVTLYNNLKVNFSVKADLFVADAYTNPYMVFTFGKKTMTVSNYTVSDGKYIFSCDGISPSQMGDEIGVALYAELNGQQYVAEYTYSVAQYCYAKLAENESDKLNTLLVDLLNYGAAAQVYSSYNNGSLCNAGLTDEQKAFGTQAAPSVSSVLNTKYATVENAAAKWKGATLQLGNAINLRVRFAAESVEGLTVKFEIGGEVYYVSQFEEDAANPGTYVATFDQIKGRQLREDIFATVYQGETAISNTVRYSVESYAAAKWNDSNAKLVALVQAMMKYGDAAVAYLG